MRILISAIVIYLVWALLHHKRDKSLTWPLFIEYLLTATLALILLIGVII